jgi:hypothetical protein
MEHLFSRCTGQLHILDSEEFRGLQVTVKFFLSDERALTYADLYAMLGNGTSIAWLTPHAFVAHKYGSALDCWEQLDEAYQFRFIAGGKVISAYALSSEHLLEICDIVLRLMAESVVQSVRLSYGVLINAPALAYLMEQCQSLKVLTLKELKMDEDHCRILGDFSRPDLEIVLDECKITSAGGNALSEVLGRNQGPTRLD